MSDSPAKPARDTTRRSFGRAWWISWAVVAVISVIGAVQIDPLVHEWVLGMQSPVLDSVARKLSWSAEGEWAAIVSLAITVIGWRLRRFDWKRAGLILLIASSLSGLTATAIRSVVGRARPSNEMEQGWVGPYHNGKWLIGKAAYNAFPSGHTGTAAGVAFAVVVLSPRFGWMFVLWAVAVAWSRIYLNCHNFADTLASMYIGFFWAWPVRDWVDRRLRPPSSHESTGPPPALT